MIPSRSPMPAPMGAAPGRMSIANITKGRQERPLRVLVYGTAGVGKTTFAADAPAPIFLCSEDGTSHMDVARFPEPRAWSDVLSALASLKDEEHPFRTVVIDSLDWLEPICWQHVCEQNGKRSIEQFEYGKGYVFALDQWRTMLARLDLLTRVRKMNVVLIGHAKVARIDDLQAGSYDRYLMKLHQKASDLIIEWVDAALFARHELHTQGDPRRGKVRGVSSGARLVHTTWTAAFDAKNRFDLPATMPLDWQAFASACKAEKPIDIEEARAAIRELLPRAPQSKREAIEKAMTEWAGDNAARMARVLDKLRGIVATEGLAEPAASQAGNGEAS